MEPEVLDLSITLHPGERAALEQDGVDPNQYVAIDFPIATLASAGPKGAVFVAQFVVPAGTFEFLAPKRVILGPDGKAPPPNMADWVGIPTTLRLVLKKAAFTQNAQDELQKSLQQQKFAAELFTRSREPNSEPSQDT